MKKLIVKEVEGPSWMAPLLVNGDDSILDYHGRETSEKEVEAFEAYLGEGWYVVSTRHEEWVGRCPVSGLLCSMTAYVCHKHVEEED